MKKALLGCAGVALVLFLVAGGAIYYFAKPFVSDYIGGITQLAELTEMNERIENKASYTPPEDEELSRAQVERFLQVQRQMKEEMGRRFDELKAKYEHIEQEGRDANYREVLGAWRDLSDLFLEAKRTQVDALNEQGFSLEEYDWVRTAVYRAASMEIPTQRFDELIEAAKDEGERAESVEAYQADTVPEQNRSLVEPYAEELQENAGLAWFGL